MNELSEIGRYLFNSPQLIKHSQKGFCRLWTRSAFLATWDWQIRHSSIGLIIEAREKIVEYGYTHTFLRVSKNDVRYIYDGVGFPDTDPWWGREDASIYQPNHQDMIHLLLLEEVGRRKQL